MSDEKGYPPMLALLAPLALLVVLFLGMAWGSTVVCDKACSPYEGGFVGTAVLTCACQVRDAEWVVPSRIERYEKEAD